MNVWYTHVFMFSVLYCWHTYIGHCNDMNEIMRSKLNTVGCTAEGPSDAFTVIYQSGLTGQLSWQAQVEAAIQDEPDPELFKEQVFSIALCKNMLYAFSIR